MTIKAVVVPIDDYAPSRRRQEHQTGSFEGAALVQFDGEGVATPGSHVHRLGDAEVVVTDRRVRATGATFDWSWLLGDIEDVVHGDNDPWTILRVSGVSDHGVAVRPGDVMRFRDLVDRSVAVPSPVLVFPQPEAKTQPAEMPAHEEPAPSIEASAPAEPAPFSWRMPPASEVAATPDPVVPTADPTTATPSTKAAGTLEAHAISAWFGTHQVLEGVSLSMAAGEVTALIGPSGCGKSTFLRILNRMHEMIPSASLTGQVLLDGVDIYDQSRRLTDARRQVGMVFQKPNPFPAMSIYDNVIAGLRLTGTRKSSSEKDDLVESCLTKAGLWTEVRDRLRQPGGALSGGQQQRLCIGRALAIQPRVLLMDEPCSALDPTSTRRIEQTIEELAAEVTIVIVTHNMQQAARVSNQCAFFLAEQGVPGVIVEHGPTEEMFDRPKDPRTNDYVNGRFG